MEPIGSVDDYLKSIPQPKRGDMEILHRTIQDLVGDGGRYLDGRNEAGKLVTNPSIGYGHLAPPRPKPAGKTLHRVGLGANADGISVYIMGLPDRTFLPNQFGTRLVKATVTGYCIRFPRLEDLDQGILVEALRACLERART